MNYNAESSPQHQFYRLASRSVPLPWPMSLSLQDDHQIHRYGRFSRHQVLVPLVPPVDADLSYHPQTLRSGIQFHLLLEVSPIATIKSLGLQILR